MEPRRLPEDPMIRQLIRHARAAQLTRRSVLAGAGAGALAMMLAACTPAEEDSGPLTPAKDLSSTNKNVVWANWQAYIDQDDNGNSPSLNAFTKQAGIKVSYDVTVDDNNTYYSTVHDALAQGKSIGADTVCLTDWMVARMARLGYLQEFDAANIPNLKNLEPQLKNPDFDPGRKRSIPWQSGYAGICWNKGQVPNGLTNVSDLWDSSLTGKVGVLSEMRDTMGLLLLDAGVDISEKFTDEEFSTAIDLLEQQVAKGQIRNVKGNDYLDDLKSGATLAAICWSGDITQLNGEAGDNWVFALPERGGTLWSDNFLVPMGSARKANVEKLINYYYEPAVAAEVAAWVNYITPVVGAKEAAAKIDPKLAEDQWIFPDENTLANAHIFRTLSPAEEQKYQTEFENVILGT
ncbi:ABC transporter substrate-binding protein [Rathayibacter soli]|uniref:ABC transporter substrate-binding protein n=1 Tax=Rathayibacter soli TaxID=3144168 RepID=UPI0027E3FD73|nr:spermidine/putrescine ABC transporter substrate-binding protein [Glaciibacter superstes]